jgi:sporulation protein YlmC with PRC-barrel domain
VKTAKVHFELLLGREVHDSDGVRVGRILSVIAEREGDDCVIREYHLGAAALLSRLGITALRIVGLHRREPLRVPWDQLDLDDPEKPRLRCRAEELKGGKR